jgi:hypothetical protein
MGKMVGQWPAAQRAPKTAYGGAKGQHGQLVTGLGLQKAAEANFLA